MLAEIDYQTYRVQETGSHARKVGCTDKLETILGTTPLEELSLLVNFTRNCTEPLNRDTESPSRVTVGIMDHFHPFVFVVSFLSQVHNKAFVSRACPRIGTVARMHLDTYIVRVILWLKFAEILHKSLKFAQVLLFFVGTCKWIWYYHKAYPWMSHTFKYGRLCVATKEHIQLIPFIWESVFCECLNYTHIVLEEQKWW